MNKHIKFKVGAVYPTVSGGSVRIKRIRLGGVITVVHQDKHAHVQDVQKNNLMLGNVKNPYDPARRGVGYIGAGNYTPTQTPAIKRDYRQWGAMIDNCYGPNPTHTMIDEWLNFQTYAEWCANNRLEGEDTVVIICLKDYKNTHYSPKTALLIPSSLFRIFKPILRAPTKYPLGVLRIRESSIYKAIIHTTEPAAYLGSYPSIAEASQAHNAAYTLHAQRLIKSAKDIMLPTTYRKLRKWVFPKGR